VALEYVSVAEKLPKVTRFCSVRTENGFEELASVTVLVGVTVLVKPLGSVVVVVSNGAASPNRGSGCFDRTMVVPSAKTDVAVPLKSMVVEADVPSEKVFFRSWVPFREAVNFVG